MPIEEKCCQRYKVIVEQVTDASEPPNFTLVVSFNKGLSDLELLLDQITCPHRL